MVEVFVFDQGVGGGRVQNEIACVSDFDEGFGEAGAAAEVCSKPLQGDLYRPTEAASRAARSSRSAAASWAML